MRKLGRFVILKFAQNLEQFVIPRFNKIHLVFHAITVEDGVRGVAGTQRADRQEYGASTETRRGEGHDI